MQTVQRLTSELPSDRAAPNLSLPWTALQAAGATSCVGFGYTLNTQALCSEYRLTSIIDTSTQPRYLNWWVDLSTQTLNLLS